MTATSIPSSQRIPMPAKKLLVGHATSISRQTPTLDLMKFAEQYREQGLFELDILGRRSVQVYGADLMAELADETRFRKVVGKPLVTVRDFAGDGLFTAHSDEANWGKAHRILLPAFGQRAMKGYFPVMLEVAQELVAKWQRTEGQDVHVADDMTRLTLDTISLAGFDHRFQSFRQAELHPFLEAMGRALTEAMEQMLRLPFEQPFAGGKRRQYEADIATMTELVDHVIRERRANAVDGNFGKDLLGLMLGATDPETGEPLSDENIRYQVLTFLIAGHETTSGLLSFALYLLLRHPHVLAQAYAEVDRVLPGGRAPSFEDIAQLDVIGRILDEALRLWPTAPRITLAPFEDTSIGGYAIPKDLPVNVLTPALHRDPLAWPNPEAFDIERWRPENKAKHHPHAYKPFGNGARACIGRQFALIEAKLALALVLQQFALIDAHDYRLKIKQSLTLKPDDFVIQVRRRGEQERLSAPVAVVTQPQPEAAEVQLAGTGVALSVLYGSNMGSSEEIAHRLGERAAAAGFGASVRTLDDAANDLPKDGLLVVVTSTYNGHPPDNAKKFAAQLENLGDLSGPRFALLGCGNTQWATYQAFPKQVEAALLAAGAQPLLPRGEADANGDFDGAVDAWLAELWATLGREFGAQTPAEDGPRYALELLSESDTRPAIVTERAHALRVVSNENLVRDASGLWDFNAEAPRGPVHHLQFELPEGVTYQAGDHLAVYAKNDARLVEAVAARFNLKPDQLIRLAARPGARSHLPLGVPVAVGHLLAEFVELQDAATRADLAVLAQHTRCPWTGRQLAAYLADTDEARELFAREVQTPRLSLFDLLARFTAALLPFELFLERLAPIRPRFYSISSSPLVSPRVVSLTVGVLGGPAWSGSGQFKGLCSSYLAGTRPGDVVFGFVREPSPPFRLPENPATPLILIGPGTGLAPLRGFLQERAAQRASGTLTGPALLFTGSRHPQHDLLHAEDLNAWEAQGVAEVRPAYSSLAGFPHRYVQDALWAARAEVWALLQDGAYLYLCGDGTHMAPAVRATLAQIYAEFGGGDGAEWLKDLEAQGRFQQDVFGPSK